MSSSNPANFPEQYVEKQQRRVLDSIEKMSPELQALWRQIQACFKCPRLVHSRRMYAWKKPSFGYGNSNSKIMVIAQSPGYKGCGITGMVYEPASRTGRLYESALTAAGLHFEDVYTTNLVKCCPEGASYPTPEEIEHCQEFLLKEISLIKPEHIIATGGFAKDFLRNNNLDKQFHTSFVRHPGFALRGGVKTFDYLSEFARVFKSMKTDNTRQTHL